nr:hypothetical protein CFP56_78966 [Quercus suber]
MDKACRQNTCVIGAVAICIPTLAVRLETVLKVLVQIRILRTVVSDGTIDSIACSAYGSTVTGRFVVDWEDLVDICRVRKDDRPGHYAFMISTTRRYQRPLPHANTRADVSRLPRYISYLARDQRLRLVDADRDRLRIHAVLNVRRGRVDRGIRDRGVVAVRRGAAGFVDHSSRSIDHALRKLVVVWIGCKGVLVVGVTPTHDINDRTGAAVLRYRQGREGEQR